ncbi:CBO0543 family protein [Neobacillus novalis]|uniref:CBO0543 family protein n=1 Tax=Neobacillus novalis TaxID=220687 RepID=A0AA95S8X1_9BACI|nr:CBO0543 family protein [Neobacillus novalis]WHY84162.1 CBO0543 family protein [Neobacillus novalis]
MQKKRLTFWNKNYFACMVLGTLFGTYLDLYFVGKQMYQFPLRPLPEIFSVNIAFTLIGLPIFVLVFVYCTSQVNKWGRAGLILFASLLMPIFEKFAEELGFFVHSNQWEHLYTFFGYFLFLSIISGFYQWLEK